jgi:RNA polymerase-associated protein
MMTLYSGNSDPYSQRCRNVLFEKEVQCRIVDVDVGRKAVDLAAISPYDQVPVLVERDLVLHESNIINEYIDGRFLNPQLMPEDPRMRARARLFLFRFDKELYANIEAIETGAPKAAERARDIVRDNLSQLVPIFLKQKFMLGDKFSMLDVAISPLLWRLEHYRVHLPKSCAPLLSYAERLFGRRSFIDSMTPAERAMRK